MLKKILFFSVIAFYFLMQIEAKSPYEIKNFLLKSRIEKISQNFIEIELENTSKKDIAGFELDFELAFCDEGSDFEDENHFLIKVDCSLLPNSSEIFAVQFEIPASFEDKTDFFVKSIFLRQVFFSDGTRWKDFFGMYSL
ncbi:hypothetical protein [Treponema pectinovorum]|uniref:hypothetical protein n=1 Tax=Treponema pectinovorum TaxID=164 RepID=UPI0011C7BE54|nr:hypothetical protein [Treponema pectinovorum]